MKKIIAALICTLLTLVACGPKEEPMRPDTELPITDSTTSQMVDDALFLTGELQEIKDNSILMDAEGTGLIWVTLDEKPDEGITLRSIVKVQFDGTVMESYPAQTSGYSLEVVELFTQDAIITKDSLNQQLTEDDANIVVVWNGLKDQVAYATEDLDKLIYTVSIRSIYDDETTVVALVNGQIPDLNWFYDKLQIQTSTGSQEVGPDFKAMVEPIIIEVVKE